MTKQFCNAALIAATFFMASCAGNKDETAPAADAGPKYRAGVEAFYDMWTKNQLDGVDTLVDANFKEHTPPPGMEINSRDGLKEMMKMGATMAPDSKIEILHYAEDGDMVYVHYRWTGTNTGGMGAELPANNKPFDIRGMDILKYANGKCVEHWGYMEEMKWMIQLGMMPDPAAASADSTAASKTSG